MARRIALLFLSVASPLILVLFLLQSPVAEILFALLVMAYPVALIIVAVGRGKRCGRLIMILLLLGVFLEACAVGMLLLRNHVVDAPWIGGLPMAAAIQLYGLWLGPLLLVTLVYALSFDGFELRQEDLDRFHASMRKTENDG